MVLELLGRPLELIRTVQQFVGQSPWAIEPLIVQLEAVVAETLGDPEGVLTRTCSAVGAGVADGSGFPKRRQHSAGVAWQYCGWSGKVDNCHAA